MAEEKISYTEAEVEQLTGLRIKTLQRWRYENRGPRFVRRAVVAWRRGMGDLLETEPHYSATQVAQMWAISEDTVRRLCDGEPGVLRISMPRLQRNRRHKPHIHLRIPASVLARLHEKWSAGFRPEVKPGRRRV